MVNSCLAYTKRGVIFGRIDSGICVVFVTDWAVAEVFELAGMLLLLAPLPLPPLLLNTFGSCGGLFRLLETACCKLIPRNP